MSSVDLTPTSWYYSKQYLLGLFRLFMSIAIGVSFIFMSKYYRVVDVPVVDGLIWGTLGYITTLGFVLSTAEFSVGIKEFFSLLKEPKNFIFIGCIWIFIGTVLTSTFDLSSTMILLYGFIAGYINQQIPM